MRKNPIPTKEQFDVLMTWLGSESNHAGQKYELIRQSLIKFFAWQGCWDAEHLADQTFDRVMKKVSHVMIDYSGDPALYFYGVARKLLLEQRREDARRCEKEFSESDLSQSTQNASDSCDDVDDDRKFECLDKCIGELSAENRSLIMDYYQEEKRAKIDFRLEIARKLGLEIKYLRVKVFRIRASLFNCMEECLGASNLVQ